MKKHFSRGLWHHSDFLKLWLGQTVSQFGSTITREALPLTALLLLNATPLQVGLLAAAASAPVLVVGLFAGSVIDRVRRRPVLIVADIGRAILLLAIPVAALLGQLRLEHLYLIAPLVSVLTVFFDVAHQSYVPTLVRRHSLVEANSKLGVSGSLAEVTAPGIAGILVQVITAPLTLLIDAASFVASAALLLTIRHPEPRPRLVQGQADALREIQEGIQFVFANPILRAFGAHAVMSSFFGHFFAALYAIYCVRVLGMTPALLGLSVACGGAGSLVGSLFAERTARRFGVGRTIIGTLAIGSVIGWLTPAAGGSLFAATGMIVAAQFFGDAERSIFEIGTLSVRQSVTPDSLMGRVNSAMYVLASGIGPFGAVVGGWLGSSIGVRETLAIAVAGSVLAGLWVVFSPIRSQFKLPLVEQA